ncbi:MAG: hypothetical protein KAH38_04295 [Candidatus Hydrogenedentes bacterium]|nr:hypothetical protein [Candidatus Hydrogenedentota bacterium]
MSSQNVMVIVLVLVGAALGAGYIIGISRSDPISVPEGGDISESSTEVLEEEKGEEELLPARPFISRETVEGLYYGLSYEAAAEKFGFSSDESETEYEQGVQGYTSPYVIHWHVWNNEEGSRVRLGFIDNKMDRKQFIASDGISEIPESPHTDVKNYGKILGMEGERNRR